MPTGPCLLCKRSAELQLSHVIPAFVYRWLRDSSGNGFIRDNRTPNRRRQDGEKRHWLCTDCEQLFGGWEKTFADRLFYPYLKSSGAHLNYAKWLMQFCVSVSWRVLQYFTEADGLQTWEADAIEQARRAGAAWREYLLGERKRPGEFEQHILPLDRIADATPTTPLAPSINRYLMRAIHMDLLRGNSSILTYAKLGRFMIFGFIFESDRNRWRGTKVHPTCGVIRPRKYEIPRSLLDYTNRKSREVHGALARVSPRQRQKIDTAFRANLDKLAQSDAFTAMRADVELFGDDAFSGTDDSKE